MRPVVLVVLAAGCIGVAPRSAMAAPACFAERSIVVTSRFYDESTGKVIGHLRNGVAVRIVDEADPDFPVVEIVSEGLRGKVAAADLRVFARHDIAVIPDFVWIRAGHPILIVTDTGSGTVEVDTEETSFFTFRATRAHCDDLSAAFEPATTRVLQPNDCFGSIVLDSVPADGKPVVVLSESDLEDSKGANRARTPLALRAGLIKETQTRALVDIRIEGHRISAWVDKSRLQLPKSEEDGRIHRNIRCGDLAWTNLRGTRGKVLAHTDLRASETAATGFFVLPKEMDALVVTTSDVHRQVLVGFPSLDPARAKVVLLAWVDKQALRQKPKPKPKPKSKSKK